MNPNFERKPDLSLPDTATSANRPKSADVVGLPELASLEQEIVKQARQGGSHSHHSAIVEDLGLDIGDEEAVSQALQRLVESGVLRKNGPYYSTVT